VSPGVIPTCSSLATIRTRSILLPENTSTLFLPDPVQIYQMQHFRTTSPDGPFSPCLNNRNLHPPRCLLSDLGSRSSYAVVEYINSLSDENFLTSNSTPRIPLSLTSKSQIHQTRSAMSSMPIASKTAEERLAVILSNQYHRRMYQNRPQWYKESPLDTAPKCFAPWRVS
jgi:hypothetical protein